MSEDMDGQSLEFTYNGDGIRTSKVVDGVVHTYTLNGSQIISEEWSNKLIIYLYDESGSPIGFAYRTTSMAANTFYYYFYEKNLQGDIVAIYNTAGTKLVSYTYDAWGKVTMTTHTSLTGTNIGAMYNPIRYRGYYYDTETGLYYLNSRYYDPETGRFLNIDDIDLIIATPKGLTDKNLYAYCDNNPVTRADYTGEYWGAITGLVLGGIFGGISAYLEDRNVIAGFIIGCITGGISGLAVDAAIATGGGAGFWISYGGGFASSMLGDLANAAVNNNLESENWGENFVDALVAGAFNALSFGMGLGDDVATGAKNLSQLFDNMSHNFITSSIGNQAGKIPKRFGSKVINLGKNILTEFISSPIISQIEYVLGDIIEINTGVKKPE